MAPATANPKLSETIKQAKKNAGPFIASPFVADRVRIKRPIFRVYVPALGPLDVVAGVAMGLGFIWIGFILGRLF